MKLKGRREKLIFLKSNFTFLPSWESCIWKWSLLVSAKWLHLSTWLPSDRWIWPTKSNWPVVEQPRPAWRDQRPDRQLDRHPDRREVESKPSCESLRKSWWHWWLGKGRKRNWLGPKRPNRTTAWWVRAKFLCQSKCRWLDLQWN